MELHTYKAHMMSALRQLIGHQDFMVTEFEMTDDGDSMVVFFSVVQKATATPIARRDFVPLANAFFDQCLPSHHNVSISFSASESSFNWSTVKPNNPNVNYLHRVTRKTKRGKVEKVYKTVIEIRSYESRDDTPPPPQEDVIEVNSQLAPMGVQFGITETPQYIDDPDAGLTRCQACCDCSCHEFGEGDLCNCCDTAYVCTFNSIGSCSCSCHNEDQQESIKNEIRELSNHAPAVQNQSRLDQIRRNRNARRHS